LAIRQELDSKEHKELLERCLSEWGETFEEVEESDDTLVEANVILLNSPKELEGYKQSLKNKQILNKNNYLDIISFFLFSRERI
jgi:hypothetical protein